ncbi:hypothetical protein KBD45_06640 [Candidatus Dojkabacteria bacterium]|nr:hypothetical protein [Candidatus Dojkabacteria bacterium]
MANIKPALLLIISGWGISAPGPANAFGFANTPNLNFIQKNFQNFELAVPSRFRLSNLQVLMSSHDEIDLESRILNTIKNNTMKSNPVWVEMIKKLQVTNSKLNVLMRVDFFGSLNYKISDHIVELLKSTSLKNDQIKYYFLVEGIKDRELLIKYISSITEKIRSSRVGEIAGVCIVDQNSFNSSVQKTSEFLVNAKGRFVSSVTKVLEELKKNTKSGEFIISKKENPYIVINALDGIVDLNLEHDKFAQDLRISLVSAFSNESSANIEYVNLCELPSAAEKVLIKSFTPNQSLTHFIRDKQLPQSIIVSKADSASVLKTMNLVNELIQGQEMVSVYELNLIKEQNIIFQKIKEKLEMNKYGLIVGYISSVYKSALSGKMEDTIQVIENLDKRIAELTNIVVNSNYVLGITSDVGLAESIYNVKGDVSIGSLNPVPSIFIENKQASIVRNSGNLKDFVPTLLNYCGYLKPGQMDGVNLLNV